MTFKCEHCNAILKTSNSLIKHHKTNKKCVETQNKDKDKDKRINNCFICEFCDKEFTLTKSLL